MRTHDAQGNVLAMEELVSQFWQRLDTLRDHARTRADLEARDGVYDGPGATFAAALGGLNDDLREFEAALLERLEAEGDDASEPVAVAAA